MDEHTTEQLATAFQETGERHLCLIELSGPEKGASFVLPQGESVAGRSQEQAQIVLLGRGISRAHASIVVEGEDCSISDLGSTNGVFVNGSRVTQGKLQPGDTVALGPEVILRLDLSDSSLREALHDLYRGANTDNLTGVLNRRSFLNRLRQEHAASIRHGHTSCLAMVDVDHFKSINDTHGHPAGDSVLVEVAAVFSRAIRTEDVVGRWGGEEFVVLMRQTDRAGALVVVERLRQELAAHDIAIVSPAGPRCIRVTVSAGLTELVRDLDATIQAADEALYQAKRTGRNRVCSSPW